MEQFVKGELLQILQSRLQLDDNSNGDCCNNNPSSVSAFNDVNKQSFFGIYSSNPTKFAFLLGERKLIKALVNHVKFIEDEKKNLSHFQFNVNGIEKCKISWKGTVRSTDGVYFGEKIKQVINKMNMKLQPNFATTAGLKQDLYEKTKFFLKSFSAEASEEEKKFVENMIDVRMNDGIVKAEALCIFCNKLGKSKKINVQYQLSKSSYSWNFSNLKRHLEKHTSNVKEAAMDIPVDLVEDSPEDTAEPECVVDKDNEITSEYVDILFTQLSVQNLKMKNAIFSHNESKKSFSFNMDDDLSGAVNVSVIKDDGNCMFGALAHQLFYSKLNSKDHKKLTAELRKNVVKHIKENFDVFAHDIKGRVFEMHEKVEDIERECNFFVNFCLSKVGFWGGMESLKAISSVYKINILIFNENGDYYFAPPFNLNHDRTVCIAFRNAAKPKANENNERNHYDSVVEIDPEIISECSLQIIEKIFKNSCNTNKNDQNKTILLE